jgi:hypothetical protein
MLFELYQGPVKAGIHFALLGKAKWIPACARMAAPRALAAHEVGNFVAPVTAVSDRSPRESSESPRRR